VERIAREGCWVVGYSCGRKKAEKTVLWTTPSGETGESEEAESRIALVELWRTRHHRMSIEIAF